MLTHFDRQAKLLVNAGYPQMLGLSNEEFLENLAPLRSRLELNEPFECVGNIPLCIAFGRGVAGIADAMSRIEAKAARGVVEMTPLSPEDFQVIEGVQIPAGKFYLLLDVDTGRSLLNVSPQNALKAISAQSRTPLTLEEGVALTAQFPELLTEKKNYNCIQMPGSRKTSDQRVPSIWFSKGAPRLGWCWDRNIHTWLGSASAAFRFGAAGPIETVSQLMPCDERASLISEAASP